MGKLKCFLFVIALYVLFPLTAYAEDIASSILIDNARQYDQKSISYTGEVVGDIMRRGDYDWINVNDGENAIGIWVPCSLTSRIKSVGSYGHVGDMVRIEGIFHRACPEHGGDFDIHCDTFDIIYHGYIMEKPVIKLKSYSALILSFISAFLIGIVLKKRI